MQQEPIIFIKNALFFQTAYTKRKPILVDGRDFCSLTYRHSGEISITCKGKTLISGTDCITFTPKNVPYTTEVLSDGHMTVVHFDFDGEPIPDHPVVIPVQDNVFRALFKSLTPKNKNIATDFSRMSILYEILAQLQQLSTNASRKSAPEKIIKAKQRLDQAFTNPFFSVEALAEELQISTSYLRREFRLIYGIAPIQYLKELRLNTAKRLLLTHTDSVASIACQCGYTNVSYFIQDFHKTVGESPNQYRQRLLF